MRFSFQGFASGLDPRRLVASDVSFQRLRRRMIEDLGLEPTHADRVLDDVLARQLTRFGDQVVAGRSKLLGSVVELRDRLDGLYHDVLSFERRSGPDTGRIERGASVSDQLLEIDRLYREIDEKLDQLGRPLHELTPSDAATRNVAEQTRDDIRRIVDEAGDSGRLKRRPGHDHRDIGRDVTEGRLSRRRFQEVEGSNGTAFQRTFADGSTATFRVENGRYVVTTRDASGTETTFREYDLLTTPYARRPLTTSLMQAHHGLQNSLMTDLFGQFGYDGGAAPTIWLRNSRRGSPHGAITATQNSHRAVRRTSLTTLSDIRRIAIEDLALTEMPHDLITAYIRAFDEYFEQAVLPKMSASDRARLLGNWQPPSGAAL
ncbi:MAG: hypothetical protein RL885_20480 [Planctomycetota bacterium]